MLKKILYIGLKVFCFILFVITIGYIGFLGHYEFKWPFLYYLFYIVPGLLLLSVVIDYFPNSWKISKKIGFYFLFFYIGLGALAILTSWRNSALKEKQFSYQLGNNSGPLRILFKNEPVQALLKKTLDILPYSTQYLIYVAEEASRVFEIKNSVNDQLWVKRNCGIESQLECLKSIYIITQENAPFNSTGNILIVSVGATLIYDQKKKTPKELKERSSLVATIQLLEFVQLVLDSSKKYSKLENTVPIPLLKLNELSPEMRNELDKTYLDGSYAMLIFGLKKDRKNKVLANLDKDVAEAYLLKKVENDLVQKSQTALQKKMNSIKERGLKKLNSKTITKAFSKVEIEDYRKKLNQYQF